MTKIEQKIPEGWSVKKLGECIHIFGGYAYSSDSIVESGIKWLKISNVGLGKLEYSHFDYLPLKYKMLTPEYILKKGDIVMALTRPILDNQLKVAYIDDEEYLLNQRVGKLILTKYIDKGFIFNKIISSEVVYKINSLLIGTDPPNLSSSVFNNINILLPPLPEQEKIAGILSCWDDGIEKLSTLIEKKKIQKKALMQQLLTGKHRLKGFSTPWHEKYLVDICDFNKGQQLNKADMLINGQYPVLNGGISYSGYTNDWNTKANMITISEGGNSCGFVSFIKEKFWCGGHCYSVFDIKTDTMFLYHLLKYNENSIMNLRVGSGLPNIQISSLYKFKVFIPSDIAEQKAIAEILSKADEEIELLNKKLEAFKQEKKALMQQLLTGKIRVKVN